MSATNQLHDRYIFCVASRDNAFDRGPNLACFVRLKPGYVAASSQGTCASGGNHAHRQRTITSIAMLADMQTLRRIHQSAIRKT